MNKVFLLIFSVSECLQYPDFSCVVLYKKLIVAFAFMVPDVGYNEAYISFIFTRPEWRRAGIGTFMLYHLIQVTKLCEDISGRRGPFRLQQKLTSMIKSSVGIKMASKISNRK